MAHLNAAANLNHRYFTNTESALGSAVAGRAFSQCVIGPGLGLDAQSRRYGAGFAVRPWPIGARRSGLSAASPRRRQSERTLAHADERTGVLAALGSLPVGILPVGRRAETADRPLRYGHMCAKCALGPAL